MDRIKPVVDESLEYYDPTQHPPPLGVKLYLLTNMGVAVIGLWGEGFIGWRPMFRASDDMKSQVIGN